MTPETLLQAAVRVGVEPSTIRKWVSRGKIRAVGERPTGIGRPTLLFDPSDVDAAANRPTGRPRKQTPLERLAEAEAAPLFEILPTGLATLQRLGRFEAAPWGVSLGGATLLGKVRFGEDWLRVWRSWSGVVYHEQAEWMDDDPDWMDTPQHAETYALLEMAA